MALIPPVITLIFFTKVSDRMYLNIQWFCKTLIRKIASLRM